MKIDTLIFDLGGVLMQHNIQGSVDAFLTLMGEEAMQTILGLRTDGEGQTGTLMEKYEKGDITTKYFIDTILKHSRPGTTPQEIRSAWITMHAGIPQQRIDYLKQLKQNGFRMYLLSNNNELHWRDVLSTYPLAEIFDGMFASHELHCCKPDKKIFCEVTKIIKSDPQATIFIDDLEANRRIAEQTIGWRTCASIEELKGLL